MSRTLAMIALRPQYWEMYKDGSKIWELRKDTHSPRGVDGLVIYATAPVSRIVGEVDLVAPMSAMSMMYGMLSRVVAALPVSSTIYTTRIRRQPLLTVSVTCGSIPHPLMPAEPPRATSICARACMRGMLATTGAAWCMPLSSLFASSWGRGLKQRCHHENLKTGR